MHEKGEPCLFCRWFSFGIGKHAGRRIYAIFVIESDEYNKHFLSYYPNIAVITNIELDHVECYDGLEDIINSFKILCIIRITRK